MPIYSPNTQGTPSRFIGPTLIPTTNTILGTVPAGRTWVVTSVIVTNTNNGIDAQFTLAIGSAAATPNAFFYNMPMGGNDDVVLDTMMPLVAGETIYGFADRTGLTVIINGYLQ